jgi:hypothetical protein
VNGSAKSLQRVESRVPPVLTVAERKDSFWIAMCALAAVVGTAVLFFLNPAEHGIFPRCLFHATTGLNCPGCGATRALHELAHGHVMAALQLNALLVVSLPLLAGLALRRAVLRVRGQAGAFVVRPAWMWLFLGVALVFSVLRNLPAFAWLSP